MDKLSNLRLDMRLKGIDAVIIIDELNQRYLSDFAFTDGLLLITLNSAHLITDFRYYEMALEDADKSFKVVMPDNKDEYISKVFASENIKIVGLEWGSVSFAVYNSYVTKYQAQGFVDIGDSIDVLRQTKTQDEIEMMQKAQDITDTAFSYVLKMISPNMTEQDVAVELEYAMRKGGASGFAFDTIAVSGDASALPHGTPRNIPLKRGFLTMDFGAKYNGYCSDMTRTIVIGKADQEMKKLYNTVLAAQKSALEFLRAGCDAGEADKVARDIIDSVPEFKGAFGHSLGHSVGLFVHENPRVSPRSFGRKLRVGEIVTVEPGIYLFGKYGCRIEDMVAIEESGVHKFTHSTKEMIEIY